MVLVQNMSSICILYRQTLACALNNMISPQEAIHLGEFPFVTEMVLFLYLVSQSTWGNYSASSKYGDS